MRHDGPAPFPVLRTERLVLTLPTIERASHLAQYHQRNLSHFAPSMPKMPAAAFSEAACALRLDAARAEFVAGTSARFVCFELGDAQQQQPIGDVSLTNIVRGPFLAAHLGYKLDLNYTGKGYMTEAVRAVVAYAFDALGLHRIMANHMPSNQQSARLLQRLGFVIEGHAKDYLYLNGAWRDHVLTSLTNPAAVSGG